VSRFFSSRPLHFVAPDQSRSLRRKSSRYWLEVLETRQLLSGSNAAVSSVAMPAGLTATPLLTNPVPSALIPSQVRQAYGLNQVSFQGGAVVGDGSGQTIAIVTANDDPTIGSDLRQFDLRFGLADPPSFVKYLQLGLTHPDSGWSLETSLDVEWAHATAPGANLVLVEAKSASISDLFNAVNFARSLPGVVAVSMSWGSSEFYGQNAFDGLFTTPAGHVGGDGLPGGVSFVAASGDSGAWYGVSYPATSPNVLAVGATTLNLGAGGSYGSESGWIGSTGGFSALEPAPAYQGAAQYVSGLFYGLRTTPDVAAVGDPATGVAVYDSVPYGGQSGWYSVGGTSAAAPQWAGLIAVADQGLALAGKGSLANAQAALYSIPSSAFHDVTTGFNGYSATAGYDLVTGLGTPIANKVVAGLLATQGVYNVSGYPAPASPALRPSIPARGKLALASITVSQAATTSTQTTGAIGSSSQLPGFAPNLVVIIVPVGSTQVLVILPPVAPPVSPFPSSRLVEPLLSTLSEPNLAFSILSGFGQPEYDEAIASGRTERYGRDNALASWVDIVEPYQAPPQDVAAVSGPLSLYRPGPAFAFPARSLTGLSWLGRDATGEYSRPIGPMQAAPVIASRAREDREEESPGTAGAARLAGVAALAGAGYYLALRESDRLRRDPVLAGVSHALKPGFRRFSLPPR
jgi:hypothetical protein